MLKLGILGSTKGTDLQAIIDAIEDKSLKDVEVSVVISDKENAYILERARKHCLQTAYIGRKDFDNHTDFNRAIADKLKENKVNLVLLIGYMKIVRKPLVSRYGNKMMNIHPSLLPKYAGGMDTNVHEEIIKNHNKETGCTLHFVTAELDSGPIILQEKVSVEEHDTPDTLKIKVQGAEKRIILKAVELYRDKKIKVENNKVIIDEN